MHDIITFGSATRDLFIKSKGFKTLKHKSFITGQGLCFGLGSKIQIDDIFFATGGGGTNTAATFAKQGFKTAYIGKIGDDPGGRAIKEELKALKVQDFASVDKDKKTPYSIIFTEKDGRTILVYHGASHELRKEEIPFNKLKTKWFYIASLSGNSAKCFDPIIEFAKRDKVKVALNPGRTQLKFPLKKAKKILSQVDILILNQEEAAILSRSPYYKEKDILKKLKDWTKGIVVITKGPRGVLVFDGKNIYQAGIFKEKKYIDRTGAGDAFGSGFVAGFMRTGKVEEAIRLGSANGTSMVEYIGAKNGILSRVDYRDKRWKKFKITKSKL